MLVVAAFAASVAGVPLIMITATRRRTRSAASGGRFSAYRYSSNHPGLTRAYPPAWFSGKLVSLATRWDELNTNVQASGQLLLPL